MWLGSYKKTKSSLSLYTPSHVPKNLSEIASSTHNMLKPLPFMRTQSQSLMCVDTKNLPIEEIDDFEPKDPDWSFPLRYVPRPADTEQIVRDFGDKYSLGSLLIVVKRS